jgi:sulfite exporter TauE/SafE
MANGLLPCGLVYASLAIPVAAGDPLVGALAMTAFGIGTAPALTAVAIGLRKVVMRDMRLRRALAAGVFLAAMWSIGARTGLVGNRHMHNGPGMGPEPGLMDPDSGTMGERPEGGADIHPSDPPHSAG